MLYPYMTLSDETEVTHSNVSDDGKVQVYFEKAVEDGFIHATCVLPDYRWCDVEGYNSDEIEQMTKYLRHNAHLIMEFASLGGFDHAAAV